MSISTNFNFKIVSININGLGNDCKINSLVNYSRDLDVDIICVQESKIHQLNFKFFSLLNDFKIIHTSSGQGVITCIKKNIFNNSKITTKTFKNNKSSNNPILCHQINTSNETNTLSLVNCYIPFSCNSLPKNFIDYISIIDIVVGDLNCYYNRPTKDREHQITNLKSFTNQTDFYSYNSGDNTKIGPDLVLLNNESDLFTNVKKGVFIGDHAALIIECSATNGVSDNNCDNSSMFKEVKKLKAFDYYRIKEFELIKDYDKLPNNPTISDFYNLWKSWLNKCLVLRKNVTSYGIFTKRDFGILNLNSQESINGFFDEWIRDANSNLSDAFSLAKHLLDCKDAEKDSKMYELNINKSSNVIESWYKLKEKIGNKPNFNKKLYNQYCRAIVWWKKQFKYKNFEYFSLIELNKALKTMNKRSIGIDRVPFAFFPFLDHHKKKLLNAINNALFNKDNFSHKLLQSRLIFIEKSNGKKRPLSIINRLACVIEKLIQGVH